MSRILTRGRSMVAYVTCIMLINCTMSDEQLRHVKPLNYVLSGMIHHEPNMACKCQMECRSATAIIKNGYPDPAYGNFTISLTAAQAEELRTFHIFDSDGVLNEFEFDRRLLKDSVIPIDFHLKVLPRNYRVLAGIISHSDVTTSDTIWEDLNGYRVSKAVSDSLWRDIPHK